jgi:hypothetical protein
VFTQPPFLFFQYNQQYDTLLPIIPCTHKLKAGIAYCALKTWNMTFIGALSIMERQTVINLKTVEIFTTKYKNKYDVFGQHGGQIVEGGLD